MTTTPSAQTAAVNAMALYFELSGAPCRLNVPAGTSRSISRVKTRAWSAPSTAAAWTAAAPTRPSSRL
jgi:hypothetical protein